MIAIVTLHAEHLQHEHVVHVRHLAHLAHERRLHLAAEYASWQAHHENQAPAPVLQPLAPQPAMGISSAAPYTGGAGSFQACVISRESGGQPQVVNASGHWGLYQFSFSTWVAYGGNPADFGNAGATAQTQIFDNAVASPGGASNWTPYDHC